MTKPYVPAFKVPKAATRARQRLPSDLQVYQRDRYGTFRCATCKMPRGKQHLPWCAPEDCT